MANRYIKSQNSESGGYFDRLRVSCCDLLSPIRPILFLQRLRRETFCRDGATVIFYGLAGRNEFTERQQNERSISCCG